MEVSASMPPDDLDIFGGYNELGLYVYGPAGMRCVLAVLIARSLLVVTGSTPDGTRRATVRNRGAEMQRKYTAHELRAMEAERRQSRPGSGFGLYGKPTKPATSGRKRRVAA